MFSVLLRSSDLDLLTAELWDAGTTGIVEEPGGIRAFFDDPDLSAVLHRFAPYDPQVRTEQSVDWEQVSRDAWPALLVGQRFFLTPPWRDDPAPEGRLRLEMTPGRACGTGHHPATQLCLEAMERSVRPGDVVLDVGAGSGILSVAAQLLGAAAVFACDVDEEAITVARERLSAPIFVGSADAVRSGLADVVVANISSAAIEELAPDLRRVAKSGGTIIVSGFPEWDLPQGLEPSEILRRQEWVCWIF